MDAIGRDRKRKRLNRRDPTQDKLKKSIDPARDLRGY